MDQETALDADGSGLATILPALASRQRACADRFQPGSNRIAGFHANGQRVCQHVAWRSISASVPIATPTGSRFLNLALFFQDDFKVTSRLTLNLGVRWDYQPLPVEQYNRLGNWNPSLIDPHWGMPGALEFANTDRRTFAPKPPSRLLTAHSALLIRPLADNSAPRRLRHLLPGEEWQWLVGRSVGTNGRLRPGKSSRLIHGLRGSLELGEPLSRRHASSAAEPVAGKRIAGRLGHRQLRSECRQERIYPTVEPECSAGIAVPDGVGYRLCRLEEHGDSSQRASPLESVGPEVSCSR